MLSASWFEPDEAVLLAWGKRAMLDLLPYRAYTTSDQTYLWPIFLGILGDIGVPLTMTTAHVLSGVFYLFLSLSGWWIFYRRHGWKWATGIVLPPAVYLFAGLPRGYFDSFPDFLSLGTELLPVGILMSATLALFASDSDVTTRRLIAGSFVAGCAIWASPQSIFVGAGLVVSAILVRTLERTSNGSADRSAVRRSITRDVLVASWAYLAPTILSLIIFVSAGEFRSFWNETVAFTFSYSSSGNSLSFAMLAARLQAMASFAIGFPFAFTWALGGLLGWHWADLGTARVRVVKVCAWVLPIVGAVLTFGVLNHLFGHYGNLLYAGAMISGVVGCRVSRLSALHERGKEANRIVIGSVIIATAALVGAITLSPLWSNVVFLRGYVASLVLRGHATPVDYFYYGPSGLQEDCPAGSHVLVWGQAAELYSYYGWIPASRYVNTDWQIFNLGNGSYARTTLFSEIEAEPPACIVEAIGTRFFGLIPATDTVTNVIPRAREVLKTCYIQRIERVGSDAGSPEFFQQVTVYVRRSSCLNNKRSS